MAIRSNLYNKTKIHEITESRGNFSVLEYLRDISVDPKMALQEYYRSEMKVRKRQVIIHLHGDNGVIVQAGEMQMMMGDVHADSNILGIGDLLKSTITSKITKETAVKPLYTGDGIVLLEPSYHFILLEDLDEWNGSMVIEEGMFLACDDTVDMRLSGRRNLPSILFGKEGLFNLELYGTGTVVLESPVPQEELIAIELKDDVVKIDGNMAVAWSKSLNFTVEKSTESLIGSALAKEGLVNVYRGTGRLLVAPVVRPPKEVKALKHVGTDK